jgi:hypothetical protein
VPQRKHICLHLKISLLKPFRLIATYSEKDMKPEIYPDGKIHSFRILKPIVYVAEIISSKYLVPYKCNNGFGKSKALKSLTCFDLFSMHPVVCHTKDI